MADFPRRIRVRSAGSGDDKFVMVENEKTTVAQVKSLIYECFSTSEQEKNLRLIYSGKLLEPATALIATQFNIKAEAVVHAVFTQRPSADIELGAMGRGGSSYVHVPSDGEEGDAGNTQQQQQPQQGGFSRLVAERGLDDIQVTALRGYFAADVAALSSRMARRSGESDAEFQNRVEDVWMDSQSPNSEFNLNLPPPVAEEERQLQQVEGFLQRQLLFTALTGGRQQGGVGGVADGAGSDNQGNYRDILVGAALGFLFGGIAILCIYDRNMSHHQKVGILIGVAMSLLMSLFGQERASASKS